MATALKEQTGTTAISFAGDERIAAVLDEQSPGINGDMVLLDFDSVEQIASAELSALIRFSLRMRAEGRRVRLANVSPFLSDLFRITRFTQMAELHE